jgi:uncharacterized OsmC-like protein
MAEQITNNINVTRLMETVNSIKQKPQLAKFRFRAKNEWIDGTHCRTTIRDFYGAGKEDTSRIQSFILQADEPSVLLGSDHGPNATEALLFALASCLNTTFMYHASAQGVKVEHLALELEGELDLRGILGIDENVRSGFEHINVTFHVKADAPERKIRELVELAQKRSAVFDCVTREVPVAVTMTAEPVPV